MFTDSLDRLPEPTRFRLSYILIAALLAIVMSSWWISQTELFARGRLEDLPDSEKLILTEIEKTGIQVIGTRNNAFGLPPSIVAKVLWNRELGVYAITRIELHHDSYVEALSSLRKLEALREIATPKLDTRERAALQKELPNVNIVNW